MLEHNPLFAVPAESADRAVLTSPLGRNATVPFLHCGSVTHLSLSVWESLLSVSRVSTLVVQ